MPGGDTPACPRVGEPLPTPVDGDNTQPWCPASTHECCHGACVGLGGGCSHIWGEGMLQPPCFQPAPCARSQTPSSHGAQCWSCSNASCNTDPNPNPDASCKPDPNPNPSLGSDGGCNPDPDALMLSCDPGPGAYPQTWPCCGSRHPARALVLVPVLGPSAWSRCPPTPRTMVEPGTAAARQTSRAGTGRYTLACLASPSLVTRAGLYEDLGSPAPHP